MPANSPRSMQEQQSAGRATSSVHGVSEKITFFLLVLALTLMFSKFFLHPGVHDQLLHVVRDPKNSGVSVPGSQMYLVSFLPAAVAVGTIVGGPVGDVKIGRKRVIWISILGMAPFALLLPFANLLWTAVLSVIIGLYHGVRVSSHFGLRHRNCCPEKVGNHRRTVFRLRSLAWRALGSGGAGEELADATSISVRDQSPRSLPAVDRVADRVICPILKIMIARRNRNEPARWGFCFLNPTTILQTTPAQTVWRRRAAGRRSIAGPMNLMGRPSSFGSPPPCRLCPSRRAWSR